MGIERLAMMKYNVDDIQQFFWGICGFWSSSLEEAVVRRSSIFLLTAMTLSLGCALEMSAQEGAPSASNCEWSMRPGPPVRVAPGITAGLLEKSPDGENPDPSFKGKAVLRVDVDEQGHVAAACSLDDLRPDLLTAAVNMMKAWKFRPYLLEMKPIRIQTTVKLRFHSKRIVWDKSLP